MGRKGVSKRKPKKSNPFSNAGVVGGSSTTRSGERSLVQPLVEDNGASFNRDGMNPSAGSNKKHKKGK